MFYQITAEWRHGRVVRAARYSAESCLEREFKAACDDWKTLSVNPAVNGHLFQIREG